MTDDDFEVIIASLSECLAKLVVIFIVVFWCCLLLFAVYQILAVG